MKPIGELLGIQRTPYRILTLDGGGVRGVIPVLWLERLERHLGGALHAHFDLIAGTSVGAVIGCALSMGMRATEVRSLWIDAAYTAFAKPASVKDHVRRLANKGGLAPKYDDSGLVTLLKSVFGDRRLGDLGVRPTLALSYNPQTLQVQVFSSAKEEHARLPIWEVCRASTAAPLFFSPHHLVVDRSGKMYPLIDGGVTANNPVVIAITEAVSGARSKSQPDRSLENVVVASFGTGAPPEGDRKEPRTIFGHGSMIVRALFHGATGTDHVPARSLLPPANYWRFQPSVAARLEPLDEIENIDELQAIALAHLADGADQRLAQLARRLQGEPLDRRWWEREEPQG